MNENSEYEIFVSGNAPRLYPTDTYFGLLYYGPDEVIEIPKLYPYSGEWGNVLSIFDLTVISMSDSDFDGKFCCH